MNFVSYALSVELPSIALLGLNMREGHNMKCYSRPNVSAIVRACSRPSRLSNSSLARDLLIVTSDIVSRCRQDPRIKTLLWKLRLARSYRRTSIAGAGAGAVLFALAVPDLLVHAKHLFVAR